MRMRRLGERLTLMKMIAPEKKKVVRDVHHRTSMVNRCIIDSLVEELNVQQSPVDEIVVGEMRETLHASSQEIQNKILKRL